MAKVRSVSVRTYRAHRFEILDDGGLGWIIVIRAPVGPDSVIDSTQPIRLRNSVPNGLATLIEEARRQVDRMLDGSDWSRAP